MRSPMPRRRSLGRSAGKATEGGYVKGAQAAPLATAGKFPQPRIGLGVAVVLTLWFLILFDPHYLLASKGVTPAPKVLPALFLVTIGLVALGVPSIPSWRRRWTWHPPLLAFIGVGIINLPFVLNTGMARGWLKEWLLSWLLVVSAVAIIDSAKRVELLILMFGSSYLWYALWGVPYGQVLWHTPLFRNPDGFGAMMVIGFSFCAYMSLAHDNRWIHRLSLAAAGLCLIGVVSSYARGAFLATIIAFAVLWLRSDNKLRSTAAIVLGSVVVSVAAGILYGDAFWQEISSVFAEGTTEGTGEDRWVLWEAAWQVFLERPILGAGPDNWGVLGSTLFAEGELGSRYSNPERLVARSLHSFHVQTLSEMGVLGTSAFLWILVDFWTRNIRLRSSAARQRWSSVGGRMNLRSMALGLELAMIAFLVTGAMYSVAGKHWFFTIQGLNLLLYHWTFKELPRPREQVGPSGPGRMRNPRTARLPVAGKTERHWSGSGVAGKPDAGSWK